MEKIINGRVRDLKGQISVFENEIAERQTRLTQIGISSPRVAGASRLLGVAAPLFDIFHIFSLDRACTTSGGVLKFRSESAGYGPDLIGSEDMFWYCYLPKIYD